MKCKRYYAAHRQDVLDRTMVDYYCRTDDQIRRYNAKALERYHLQQAALKRSKVYKEKLREMPYDEGYSILSLRQLEEPMFVVEDKNGRTRNERLTGDELVEW